MLGLWTLLFSGLFLGVWMYRGSRSFNYLNELGVMVFESYWQLLFYRVGSFFLGVIQFVFLLAALMFGARWVFS